MLKQLFERREDLMNKLRSQDYDDIDIVFMQINNTVNAINKLLEDMPVYIANNNWNFELSNSVIENGMQIKTTKNDFNELMDIPEWEMGEIQKKIQFILDQNKYRK